MTKDIVILSRLLISIVIAAVLAINFVIKAIDVSPGMTEYNIKNILDLQVKIANGKLT